MTVRGGDLRAALENGLSQPGAGRFPQIAGLRIVADLSRPAGQRLVSAEVLAGERAGPLDNERAYRVATHNFLRRGGDGYVDAARPRAGILRHRAAGGGSRRGLDGRTFAAGAGHGRADRAALTGDRR